MENNFFGYGKSTKEPPACIFIVLDDENKDKVIEQMKILSMNLKMKSIIITDVKDKASREFMDIMAEKRVCTVPKSGLLSALLCIMPLQRLAYDLTIAKGYDPDRPRNLAKELTTK